MPGRSTPRDGGVPTVRRRRLAQELRQLRDKAGLTIADVAAVLECSDSKVSRIENGRVSATPRDVRDMLALYKVGADERERLMRIAREARQRGWWQSFSGVSVPALVGLEDDAAFIKIYTALIVPGLFQTEDYARAVLEDLLPEASREDIESAVQFRLARQQRLRHSDAPVLTAVIDEAVLRRPVGGVEVMRQQLEYLVEAAELPAVTLQVLQLNTGLHAGADGDFEIIEFSDSADPDVVYTESYANDVYIEDVGAVKHYKRVFDHLREAALRPAATKPFFATLAKELQG